MAVALAGIAAVGEFSFGNLFAALGFLFADILGIAHQGITLGLGGFVISADLVFCSLVLGGCRGKNRGHAGNGENSGEFLFEVHEYLLLDMAGRQFIFLYAADNARQRMF
ncbi:hypothetical protein D3C85_1644460 [compost metagenome]